MVKTGLEVLLAERRDLLSARRVGLVTHPAAVRADLTGALDALLGAAVKVTTLFSPEHGLDAMGAKGAAAGDGVDARTGLPVRSLYDPNRELTPEMLTRVDLLVLDLQGVGVRACAYLSTLYRVLRGAAKAGRPLIVLDRPNPINGQDLEGPLLQPGLQSFVGVARIPIRHGLTVGELARFLNTECELGADLTIIGMRGWRRHMWFDDTRLPWVPTSPAMPHLSTLIVYPGTCLVEGTNLSEGRGTTTPFEVVGAPWLDGYRLASALNQVGLPGVRFRPLSFAPCAGKHAGRTCGGVQVHVISRDAFRPVATGLHLVAAARAQAPDEFRFIPSDGEGSPPLFDLLAGTPRLREGLEAGEPVRALMTGWAAEVAKFEAMSNQYRLYG